MHLIETYIQGKENNPQTCEDGIFISGKLVAVIDGATTAGRRLWDGHKSGYFAKEVLLQSLQEIVRGAESGLLRDEHWGILLLQKLNLEMQKAVSARTEEEILVEEYPRASIILYNDMAKELISYGDCQCSINGVLYQRIKKIDVLNADLRAYHLEYHLMHGKTLQEMTEEDPGRNAILKNLSMQCAFENIPGEFGYPVLNGRGIEPSMIKSYKVSAGDEVILASDGYPKLCRSLVESEAALRQVLEEDPMFFRTYRSTKGIKKGNVSFDDRAYCRFTV